MIYVNSDASYRGAWAGIAYESAALGSDSRFVACARGASVRLRWWKSWTSGVPCEKSMHSPGTNA